MNLSLCENMEDTDTHTPKWIFLVSTSHLKQNGLLVSNSCIDEGVALDLLTYDSGSEFS